MHFYVKIILVIYMKRIGIDIDGCLTDVYNWYLKNGYEYAKGIGKSLVNEKGYDAMEMYGLTLDEFMDLIDKSLVSYSVKEPARENASQVCNKLIKDGYELIIITARFGCDKEDEDGLKMRTVVENWFKDNNIAYTQIIYSSENKLDICLEKGIDIMIEDKPDTLLEIKEYIPVICFDAPYNRDIDNNNLYRVFNWNQVLDIIENKKEN